MSSDEAIRAAILAESDRRDRELTARLSAWREGYNAAQQDAGAVYDTGYHDGRMALKHAQHDTFREVRQLQIEHIRWGPGGRLHFADPRPGDYPGTGSAT